MLEKKADHYCGFCPNEVGAPKLAPLPFAAHQMLFLLFFQLWPHHHLEVRVSLLTLTSKHATIPSHDISTPITI